MTANKAGKVAIDGFWGSVRTLRDQWFLLVFMAGALVWARDTYHAFSNLPVFVRQQEVAMASLETAVTRLEASLMQRLDAMPAPALRFSTGHLGLDDGAPDDWTVLRWQPIRNHAAECVARDIDAFMVDADGRWFAAVTAITVPGTDQARTGHAFGIRIPPKMAAGPARAGVRIVSECGSRRLVEIASWLPFRVIGG
jgi:hypothetical protein